RRRSPTRSPAQAAAASGSVWSPWQAWQAKKERPFPRRGTPAPRKPPRRKPVSLLFFFFFGRLLALRDDFRLRGHNALFDRHSGDFHHLGARHGDADHHAIGIVQHLHSL